MTEYEQKLKPDDVIAGQFTEECAIIFGHAAKMAGDYSIKIMAFEDNEFTCPDGTTCKVMPGHIGLIISHSSKESDFSPFWKAVNSIEAEIQKCSVKISDLGDLNSMRPRIFIKPPKPRLRFFSKRQ